jgi:hypothetical protein
MRSISIAAALLAVVSAGSLSAQAPDTTTTQSASATTDQALIANALSAAPPAVAATASVQTADGRVLHKGSSDWVCMPDAPDAPNNSPMCLDSEWRSAIGALMHKRPPKVAKMGFAYMLQGDLPVSNMDPFATAPTPTNQWIQNGGPHIMVLVPDPKLLEGISTDPENGGPFVMWKGTPYAHLMIPTVPRER